MSKTEILQCVANKHNRIALNTYMIQCAWAEINWLNVELQKLQEKEKSKA